MEFIRKALRLGHKDSQKEAIRGVAPVQSQEEQDQTRNRMEAGMALQKERRDAGKPDA